MQKTIYQRPEIRDANDDIIQAGSFGKNTPLANSTNDGWIDYVMNNLEALYDDVGGVRQSAADARTAANKAEAKANEAAEVTEENIRYAAQAYTAMSNAQTAAEAAMTAAERAAAIVTPDGLAARVLALEALPHFEYDENGELYFCWIGGTSNAET